MSAVDRRTFLAAGAQGLLAAGALAKPRVAAAATPSNGAEVVVIGAGAFGGWTALHMALLGARVTLVDAWGPGNARSTSGDETRGVRSSYGDRAHGELWSRWATQAIQKWQEWDERWGEESGLKVFFATGDLIFREDWEPFLVQTRAIWDRTGVRYEVLSPADVRQRWPNVFDLKDVGVVLYEEQAGVVRARRSCEAVADTFRKSGGQIHIGRATIGRKRSGRVLDVTLSTGGTLSADTYVFACGPWLPKIFPELLSQRMRTPTGYVFYYGTPPGDNRYTHPNLPSWNFPGVTGWPALGRDNRGFRVRTGGGANRDPDSSDRYVEWPALQRPRSFLMERFPGLEDAPVLQTHACHYESSVSRNFIIAPHPELENVWITGAGSAEAFKSGPVIGEYIAKRVFKIEDDPELAKQFAIPKEIFDEEEEQRRRSEREAARTGR
jgi:glycine/D-amino acid oxidase-like deaminating enzyme